MYSAYFSIKVAVSFRSASSSRVTMAATGRPASSLSVVRLTQSRSCDPGGGVPQPSGPPGKACRVLSNRTSPSASFSSRLSSGGVMPPLDSLGLSKNCPPGVRPLRA